MRSRLNKYIFGIMSYIDSWVSYADDLIISHNLRSGDETKMAQIQMFCPNELRPWWTHNDGLIAHMFRVATPTFYLNNRHCEHTWVCVFHPKWVWLIVNFIAQIHRAYNRHARRARGDDEQQNLMNVKAEISGIILFRCVRKNDCEPLLIHNQWLQLVWSTINGHSFVCHPERCWATVLH